MRKLISVVALAAAMAACGQPSTSASEAQAQTGVSEASATAGGEVTDAERTAILAAMNATADASGQIDNECGEKVTPQFQAANLGEGPGRVVAFILTGGPNTASCYGDGPLVQLMRANGASWTQIYMNRGGPAIVLPTTHNGANDLADGGPGFSFPVWQWNGTEYVDANREVADSALGEARYIPN